PPPRPPRLPPAPTDTLEDPPLPGCATPLPTSLPHAVQRARARAVARYGLPGINANPYCLDHVARIIFAGIEFGAGPASGCRPPRASVRACVANVCRISTSPQNV